MHRQLALTLERPDGSRSDFVVAKPFARVGRDRRAEVALDDPQVIPCHAYLESTPDGIYCAGLAASAPTGWLSPDHPIQISGFRIYTTLHGAAPAPSAATDLQTKHSVFSPYPHVRVYTAKGGEDDFMDYSLTRRLTLVGRQSPATWRIKHPTLSRLHCALVWDAGELWLIDLFSSNGTRVEGQKFDTGRIDVGQEFNLGTIRCRFLGAADEPIAEASPRKADKTAHLRENIVGVDRRPHSQKLPAAIPSRAPVAGLADTSLSAAGDTKFVEAPTSEPAGEHHPPETDNVSPAACPTGDASHDITIERKLARLEESVLTSQRDFADERQVVAAKLVRFEAMAMAVQERLNQLSEQHQAQRQASAHQLEARLRETEQEWTGRLDASLKNQREAFQQVIEAKLEVQRQSLAAQRIELERSLAALPEIMARGEGLERRFEQATAALAQQLLALREELHSLVKDWGKQHTDLAAEVSHDRQQRELERTSLQESLAAGNSHSWEERRRELTDEMTKRGEESDRRYAQWMSATEERIAGLDAAVMANLADLHARQQQLAADMAAAKKLARPPEPVWPAISESGLQPPASASGQITGHVDADVAAPADLPAASFSAEPEEAVASGQGDNPEAEIKAGLPVLVEKPVVPAIKESFERRANTSEGHDEESVLECQLETPEDAPWMANDELTQRLLDFRTKREKTSRRRRLIWSFATAGLVLVVLAVAGMVRLFVQPASENEAPQAPASEEEAP